MCRTRPTEAAPARRREHRLERASLANRPTTRTSRRPAAARRWRRLRRKSHSASVSRSVRSFCVARRKPLPDERGRASSRDGSVHAQSQSQSALLAACTRRPWRWRAARRQSARPSRRAPPSRQRHRDGRGSRRAPPARAALPRAAAVQPEAPRGGRRQRGRSVATSGPGNAVFDDGDAHQRSTALAANLDDGLEAAECGAQHVQDKVLPSRGRVDRHRRGARRSRRRWTPTCRPVRRIQKRYAGRLGTCQRWPPLSPVKT